MGYVATEDPGGKAGVVNDSVTINSLTRKRSIVSSSIATDLRFALPTARRPMTRRPTARAPIANAPTAKTPRALAPIAALADAHLSKLSGTRHMTHIYHGTSGTGTESLLSREPVRVDEAGIRAKLRGQTILVTGAARLDRVRTVPPDRAP